MDDIIKLLNKWDNASSHEEKNIENVIASQGDAVIDDILNSIAEINSRMNGSIPAKGFDPKKEMTNLERRIRFLGKMRNMNTLKSVFNALADSAIAAEQCKYDRNMSYAAQSLLKTSEDALVNFGTTIIPHARRYMLQGPPPVTKALGRVVDRLEKKWWKFW